MPSSTPYTDEFYQGLVGYVRHFNMEVQTVDGPGILRNFYYASPIRGINGLEIEMLHTEAHPELGTKLVTYNFAQVTLPGVSKGLPLFNPPDAEPQEPAPKPEMRPRKGGAHA